MPRYHGVRGNFEVIKRVTWENIHILVPRWNGIRSSWIVNSPYTYVYIYIGYSYPWFVYTCVCIYISWSGIIPELTMISNRVFEHWANGHWQFFHGSLSGIVQWSHVTDCYRGYIICWLVVWNMNFMTFHILGIMIPTDFHIFQRGRYTTNQILIHEDIIWYDDWTIQQKYDIFWIQNPIAMTYGIWTTAMTYGCHDKLSDLLLTMDFELSQTVINYAVINIRKQLDYTWVYIYYIIWLHFDIFLWIKRSTVQWHKYYIYIMKYPIVVWVLNMSLYKKRGSTQEWCERAIVGCSKFWNGLSCSEPYSHDIWYLNNRHDIWLPWQTEWFTANHGFWAEPNSHQLCSHKYQKTTWLYMGIYILYYMTSFWHISMDQTVDRSMT